MFSTAEQIHNDFVSYLEAYNEITGRARQRFENADWQEASADSLARLNLYRDHIAATLEVLRATLPRGMGDRETWRRFRSEYEELIESKANRQLAETWFNSITRKVFHTVGVDKDVEFVDRDFDPPTAGEKALSLVVIEVDGDPASAVRRIVEKVEFETAFADLESDATIAGQRIADSLGDRLADLGRIEMVGPPFFRGHSAYLIGRMALADGTLRPLVITIRNPSGQLIIDAVILREDDVSILFSFTRSYFRVAIERPSSLIAFLATLMPRKRIAELYTSLGHNKHGKTELYRDLLTHLDSTDHKFKVSRGAVGLVMIVFDMDDYDIVFKIIRDTFPPPKTTTRGAVMGRYRLVFEHDRAGRLVEAHEFEHLSLRESRFDQELVEILREEASRTIEFANERLIISHAYLERKVIPLNLYIREQPKELVEDAIVAYGRCIKDLMVSNIFPGDMLLKNFGVTRHGRVVFYDYDELGRITDCRFRPIPDSDDPLDEMADTPWFSVGEGDVFPEEFPRFMGLAPDLMRLFRQHHDDLFDHRTWVGVQQRLMAGELIEIFPYGPELRFSP